MQPQILDSGSLEVLSPLEGRIFGEGTFGGDGSGGGAAFQSLMGSYLEKAYEAVYGNTQGVDKLIQEQGEQLKQNNR